jgi:hypothetical protein
MCCSKIIVFLLQTPLVRLELGYTLFKLLKFALFPLSKCALRYPILLSTTLSAEHQYQLQDTFQFSLSTSLSIVAGSMSTSSSNGEGSWYPNPLSSGVPILLEWGVYPL